MRRSVFNLLILLLVVPVLAGCDLLYGALFGFDAIYDWKQKITVSVETPQGVKKASSVQHIQVHLGKKHPPNGARGASYETGEAVVLELAPGKYLFALLKGEKSTGNAEYIAGYTFYGAEKAPHIEEANEAVLSQPLHVAKDIPRKSYPLMVMFEDITDPKTVKQVNPNYLEGTFGPGFKLKSITLEITDEPVTEGKVEAVLRWIRTQMLPVNKHLQYGHPMRNILNQDFRRKQL